MPPADLTMAVAAGGPLSPFAGGYAYCSAVPGGSAAACKAMAPDGLDGSGRSSPASMDHDGGNSSAAAACSLDALLAAASAARKPGAGWPEGLAACGDGAERLNGGPPPPAAALAPPAILPTPQLPPAARAVLGLYGAARIAGGDPTGVAGAASSLIRAWGLADTFYVYDLGEVARLHAAWTAAMPRVAPFYAVKCNPEPGVMAMLAALGAGFDCASVQELERAAALGVPQSRVIFANPCKRPGDFRYAAERGVEYTTFDCASELEKIAAGYPAFKCVLRIRCDDETCKINLGLKYGADPLEDVPSLLALARDLGLQVVGVSFHVGSGCQNVGVYADAIGRAREAFDAAPSYGFTDMHLLDIGGGFTAPHDPESASLFYRTAGVINRALSECFPEGCGVRIIAEPGRYYAETSATLFTTILGQRAGLAAEGGAPGAARDYWLSDGTYGSFRIQVAVDGLEPSYTVLRSPLLPPSGPELEARLPCRLWGDSGRDGDCVHRSALLPALRDGDWLAFPCAGAYTICSASRFGGAAVAAEPTKMFVFSEAAVRDLGEFNDPAAQAAAAAALPAPRAACCGFGDEEAAAAAAAEMLRALSFSGAAGRASSGSSCGTAGGLWVAEGARDAGSACDMDVVPA